MTHFEILGASRCCPAGIVPQLHGTGSSTTYQKHGVSLTVGLLLLERAIGSIADERFDYGEARRLAFGLLDGQLYVCVYTIRGSVHRITSVRRASDKEEATWLS